MKKNNCFLKKERATKQSMKKFVFEIMLHYSSNITISKSQKF